MKYIKKFERVRNYKIGDYILINIPFDYSGSIKYTEFINNNIGQITEFGSVEAKRVGEPGDADGLAYTIEIEYNNIPESIIDMFSDINIMSASEKYIVEFGTKKELESILSANKYNL